MQAIPRQEYWRELGHGLTGRGPCADLVVDTGVTDAVGTAAAVFDAI